MKILLLGPGKMGGSWLHRLVSTDFYDNIDDLRVIQPSMSKQAMYSSYSKVSFYPNVDNFEVGYKPDIVIIAVKPQMFEVVLSPIKAMLSNAFVMSIAAGKSIAEIKQYADGNEGIVRIMPNIGMSIGKSVNLIYADEELSAIDKEVAESLLKPTGNQYWLSSEAEIDKFTPITGSSPAFYYLLSIELMRCMTEESFDYDMTRRLVADTFAASALYAVEDNRGFSDLIADVASKEGVTRAALEVMEPAMRELMTEVYKAAIRRIEKIKDIKRK